VILSFTVSKIVSRQTPGKDDRRQARDDDSQIKGVRTPRAGVVVYEWKKRCDFLLSVLHTGRGRELQTGMEVHRLFL
jgi:hypothetical protein